MALAKTQKLKEYNTDILTHNHDVMNDDRKLRNNNTFKSSVLDSDFAHHK